MHGPITGLWWRDGNGFWERIERMMKAVRVVIGPDNGFWERMNG